jgi:hypothetical protein
MTNRSASINLTNALKIFKKSSRAFSPLFELLTNALEAAILNSKASAAPAICVRLLYASDLFGGRDFVGLEVQDEGVGFDDENFARFKTLLDTSKGYNNRGSGRLQYLHRFEIVKVVSTFKAGKSLTVRNFKCTEERFVFDETVGPAPKNVRPGSTVRLESPKLQKLEKQQYEAVSAQGLAIEIRTHLLLWLYLDGQSKAPVAPTINIEFLKDGKVEDSSNVRPQDIPDPAEENDISVPYRYLDRDASGEVSWRESLDDVELIKFAHFRMPEGELPRNQIYLCSKKVPVERVKFPPLKKSQSIDGSRFLTVFYGDALDDSRFVSSEGMLSHFQQKSRLRSNFLKVYLRKKVHIYCAMIWTEKSKLCSRPFTKMLLRRES